MRCGVIHYEYPLSERIRTLLRLEDLFDRFDAYAALPMQHAHHAALQTLFEVAEVAARADLKSTCAGHDSGAGAGGDRDSASGLVSIAGKSGPASA
jgi:hypothetical protein